MISIFVIVGRDVESASLFKSFAVNRNGMPMNESIEPIKANRQPRKTTKTTRLGEESNFDQRLGFLMHDASRLRRIVFDNFVKPLDLTRSQWWVLAHLSRHDGMIQSDLAGTLELGKAALGGLIDRLEASGFIERRPDVNDRRVKRVYLASKGNQIVKEMRSLSHDMNEDILQGLEHEQRLQLSDFLSRLKQNLVKIKRDKGIED
jgi:DNA-binding MarR family transcriptional regulator